MSILTLAAEGPSRGSNEVSKFENVSSTYSKFDIISPYFTGYHAIKTNIFSSYSDIQI